MALAATKGWNNILLVDIAAKSDVDLGTLLQTYDSKPSIIKAFIKRMDDHMLSALTDDPNAPVRDRLFDIIMNRFDGLTPFRAGLISIARAQACDPLRGLCLLIWHRRSLKLMLETANLPTSGLRGFFHLNGLGFVYANAVRIWIKDDSTDLAKTMTAVDQGLSQAEKLAVRHFRKPNAVD